MLPTKTSSVEAIAVVLLSLESRFWMALTVADTGIEKVSFFVPACVAAAAKHRALKLPGRPAWKRFGDETSSTTRGRRAGMRACEKTKTGQRRRNAPPRGHVIIAWRRRYSACQLAISPVQSSSQHSVAGQDKNRAAQQSGRFGLVNDSAVCSVSRPRNRSSCCCDTTAYMQCTCTFASAGFARKSQGSHSRARDRKGGGLRTWRIITFAAPLCNACKPTWLLISPLIIHFPMGEFVEVEPDRKMHWL